MAFFFKLREQFLSLTAIYSNGFILPWILTVYPHSSKIRDVFSSSWGGKCDFLS